MLLRDPNELMQGELLIDGRLIDATNATLFGRLLLHPSNEFTVVYKPIAGERPLWDFPDGNLASREVASFLISRAGQFNCVPTTVLREGPFGLGAVQQWIDVDFSIDVIALGQSDEPAIRNLALFDAIVNNTDRKFGHILPVTTSEVYGCDHGVTFHSESKLRTVLWQFSGQQLTSVEVSQIQLVREFVDDSVEFQQLLTISELAAIKERISALENQGFPEPSNEWPAVPWPPV